MNVAKRVGANIVAHRNRIGISQEELAWRAGLHRTAIGLLERGERVPRVDNPAQARRLPRSPPWGASGGAGVDAWETVFGRFRFPQEASQIAAVQGLRAEQLSNPKRLDTKR